MVLRDRALTPLSWLCAATPHVGATEAATNLAKAGTLDKHVTGGACVGWQWQERGSACRLHVQAERSPGVWVGVSGREAWGVREAWGL